MDQEHPSRRKPSPQQLERLHRAQTVLVGAGFSYMNHHVFGVPEETSAGGGPFGFRERPEPRIQMIVNDADFPGGNLEFTNELIRGMPGHADEHFQLAQ